MFDIDRWQEIFSSIRSNLLRTILSGFTVALGLYIFVVLFGMGNGLNNAFNENFSEESQNLIIIFTGKTTQPYRGLGEDREVVLNNSDYDFLKKESGQSIENSSSLQSMHWSVKYGQESGRYSVEGVTHQYQKVSGLGVIQGRFFHQGDIANANNTAIIGRMVQRDLIKNGNAIGKDIEIDGKLFKIVGIFSDKGGDWRERKIFLPISTMQGLKKFSDTIHQMQFSYRKGMSPEEALALGENLEMKLKQRKKVAPEDKNGVVVGNNAKNKEDTFQFMMVLGLIVGFIGMGTLLAGIVGISNIMVYIVKERTKEIGIRKAIGASPSSIVALIMQESIVITLFSGLVGVLLGILTLNLIGNHLEKYFIKSPSVGGEMVVFAFFCLVFSGALAGFIPAYRASKIKPIEALRTE